MWLAHFGLYSSFSGCLNTLFFSVFVFFCLLLLHKCVCITYSFSLSLYSSACLEYKVSNNNNKDTQLWHRKKRNNSEKVAPAENVTRLRSRVKLRILFGIVKCVCVYVTIENIESIAKKWRAPFN